MKGLQEQFYDRDKPFFEVFGEELMKHKQHAANKIEEIRRDFLEKKTGAEHKVIDLAHKFTVMEGRLKEAEVLTKQYRRDVETSASAMDDFSKKL